MVGGKGEREEDAKRACGAGPVISSSPFILQIPPLGVAWFPMMQESITHKEMGCTVTRLTCIKVLGCGFLHQQDWWSRDACSGSPFWTEL